MERETFVLQFIEFSIDTGRSVFSPKHKIHHQREEKKQTKVSQLAWEATLMTIYILGHRRVTIRQGRKTPETHVYQNKAENDPKHELRGGITQEILKG